MKNLSQVSHLQKSSESLTKRAYNNENRPNCCARTHTSDRGRALGDAETKTSFQFNHYNRGNLLRHFSHLPGVYWMLSSRSFVGTFSCVKIYLVVWQRSITMSHTELEQQFLFFFCFCFCSTRKVRWCRWQSISVFVCSFLMEILCNSAWEAKRSWPENCIKTRALKWMAACVTIA